MNIGILIIAHAPLASALRQCVLHVYPDSGPGLVALDVRSDISPDETLATARVALGQLMAPQALVVTDVFGATPCNVAQKLVDGVNSRLLAGVNLPMLLRCVNYRHEPLEALVARALTGAGQGIMQVATTAPQNQLRKKHDKDHNDHQQ